jgi:hypothetical protein
LTSIKNHERYAVHEQQVCQFICPDRI